MYGILTWDRLQERRIIDLKQERFWRYISEQQEEMVSDKLLHNCLFFFHGCKMSIFFSFFFNCSKIALQCCVCVRYKTKWIDYMHMFIPSLWASLPSPTPLDHHRALSWTPCTIQQLPTSYLFYAHMQNLEKWYRWTCFQGGREMQTQSTDVWTQWRRGGRAESGD